MDNLSRAGKTILIIIITISALSIAVSMTKPRIVYIQDPNYVQNIYEAQGRLKEQGLYDGKVDGIWGPGTDKAYCDWAAMQTFTGE